MNHIPVKPNKKPLYQATFTLLFALSFFRCFSQISPEQEIKQYASNINGNVGVHAILLETGETISYQADQQFPMQSVYKFPIAMAVLHQIDQGKLSLNQVISVSPSDYIPEQGYSLIRERFPKGVELTIRELLEYTIRSDGSASDVLLKTIGGAKVADQYVSSLGIADEAMAIALPEMIQVANDTIQYQNYATPQAMTKLLNVFYTDNALSAESQDLLFQMMIDSRTGLGRIKGLLPKGTMVAHKTGTSATYNGLTRATNDAGIIVLPNGNHLAITVFVSDSYASDKDRDQVIANIAKAVFDYWADE